MKVQITPCKLGYGGTQAEMQKLLKDAEKIQRANGQNVKYNIKNLDDIIEAIHVIQTEMGVTGTTADEAADTISGSFNAFKATWKNLLSGIANEDADIDHLMGNLFVSGKNLLENIWEVVPQIARSAKHAFEFIVEEATDAMPALKSIFVDAWDKKLPAVVTDGANGIISIINGIFGTNIPAIKEIKLPTWAEMEKGFSTWWASARANLETAATWTLGIFTAPTETADEIKAAIAEWWEGTARPALQSMEWSLSSPNPPKDGISEVSSMMATWWNPIGEGISNMASWTLQMANVPTETADDVSALIKNWWNSVNVGLGDITTIGFHLAAGDEESALGTLKQFWENVKTAFGNQAVIHYDIMAPQVEPVANAIKEWWASVTSAVSLTLPIGAGSSVHIDEDGSYSGGGGRRFGDEIPGGGGRRFGDEIPGGGGRRFGDEIPGFATSLDYVPYDNFFALLHEGEAVLTASEANVWRNESTDNRNGYDFARIEALLSQILQAAQNPQPVPAVIDGNDVFSYVSRRQQREISTRRYT